MRRLNLISVDELDHTGVKQSRVLGQGAFGIVYAVIRYMSTETNLHFLGQMETTRP